MPAHTPGKHMLCSLLMLGVLCLCGSVLFGLTARPASAPTETSQPATQDAAETPNDTGAQECVVTFTSGRKLTGIMMKSDDKSLVLRINGIDTTYRRARIASVEFLPPVAQRFREFRDSLDDSDINGRLMLVDWLRERRAYELAIEELDSILLLEPHHPNAKILKTWLLQHLKLAKSKTNRQKDPAKSSTLPTKQTIPLLTDDQINLVRVFEIDLLEPPRFIIEDTLIQELMRRSPERFPVNKHEREALSNGTNLEKLKLLFRHKARDLYPQVRVLDDPASFQFFKKNIAGRTGWLTNGCATTRCHGGDQAGELRLTSRSPNSDKSLYTNFVVLNQFTLGDGTAMINFTDPERSPLVQMGLVRSGSLYPHPEIDPTEHGRDWRAVFRSTKAKNFVRTTDWIRSLYTPRPDYGFTYPPTPESSVPPVTLESPETAPLGTSGP